MKFKFNEFILDIDRHELRKNGMPLVIEPQVFDLLHLLVRNAGDLITKDQMIDEIWDGRIVSESTISARIAVARKAVDDSGKSQAVIKTVARRGLRFVAAVEGDIGPPVKRASNARPERLVVKYARAEDGAMLAYAMHGDGPPLVRIGHFPSDISSELDDPYVGPTITSLADEHTVIRYDYRGSGMSERRLLNTDPDAHAKDLLSVLDAAGIAKVALMGMSGGAMTAVHFAVMYPERVSKLILQAGYVDGRSVREGNDTGSKKDSIGMMISEGWQQHGSPFVAAYIGVYFPGAPQEYVNQIAADMQNHCSAENINLYREMTNIASISGIIADVSMPTLVLHSRDDAVHPLSEAQKLASGIPNAELIVLDSPNHYVMHGEDCWQDHLDAILEFLR